MRAVCTAILAAAVLLQTLPAHASEEAAKKAGCDKCHAVDTKKLGPSYKDVSAKHKGDAGAEAKIFDKIRKASGHPAVKASDDELKALVKYALSQ